jgi:hypothetical protein
MHPFFTALFILPAIVAAVHIRHARTARNVQVLPDGGIEHQ